MPTTTLCSTRAWNLRNRPSSDATVGERSRNSKFSYGSPRSIYGETCNEGKESSSTYPCRALSGSVQVNGVDGVVLAVIQITDDQVPNGRHLRVQHTYSPMTSPMPYPARREGEVEEDSIQQQHNGVVVVEERGTPAGLRQAPLETKRREVGLRQGEIRSSFGQPLG